MSENSSDGNKNSNLVGDIAKAVKTHIGTDNDLQDERKKREQNYSQLISVYTDFIDKTIKFKNRARLFTFFVFSGLLILIILFTIIVFGIVIRKNKADIGSYVIVISTIVTFVSTIIIIPQKMVEFIFNKDEDKYIVELIKNTQNFDKS